jgi:drug/metabolite transporter (DMT)-like permease
MQRRHIVWLVIGVTAVSTSAVLIRAADDRGVSSLAIAFYRCVLASAVLVPLALARHRRALASLSRRQRWLLVASGAALGLHFVTWISSLSYTSVAASTVLVQSMPIWVAIAGMFTGERTTRRGWLGIWVAIAGGVVIATASSSAGGSNPALGDVLAVAGAIFAAIYVVIGRHVRAELSLVPYSASVYGVAAGLLGVAMLVTGTPFLGYSTQVWALFVAMTIGPQFLGHTVINHLLGELKASIVSVALLAEAVGATILAYLIFGERPGAQVVLGGALVLAGVAITVLAESAQRPEILAMPEE